MAAARRDLSLVRALAALLARYLDNEIVVDAYGTKFDVPACSMVDVQWSYLGGEMRKVSNSQVDDATMHVFISDNHSRGSLSVSLLHIYRDGRLSQVCGAGSCVIELQERPSVGGGFQDGREMRNLVGAAFTSTGACSESWRD